MMKIIEDVIALEESQNVNIGTVCFYGGGKKRKLKTIEIVRNLGYILGRSCAVFIPGMNTRRFVRDLLVYCARISPKEAERNLLFKPEKLQQLRSVCDCLKNCKIYIDDSKDITPEDIRNKCKSREDIDGVKIDTIIIGDVSFLMDNDSNNLSNFLNEYRSMREGLYGVAKELQSWIIGIEP